MSDDVSARLARAESDLADAEARVELAERALTLACEYMLATRDYEAAARRLKSDSRGASFKDLRASAAALGTLEALIVDAVGSPARALASYVAVEDVCAWLESFEAREVIQSEGVKGLFKLAAALRAGGVPRGHRY